MLNMSKVVAAYWKTRDVCIYFGGIHPRTLKRWADDPVKKFPKPIVSKGQEALYPIEKIKAWAAAQEATTENTDE